jgi:enterochelin esterase family protein
MRLTLLLCVLVLLSPLRGADALTATELVNLAKTNPAALEATIPSSFDAKKLAAGTAWAGHGQDFFFATEAASKPQLLVDDAPGPEMQPLANGHLWYAVARIAEVGRLHAFHYIVNGARFGGSLDVPAFTPLAYLEPGVPSGILSSQFTHTSKLYDGMKSNYWFYVPAQYDGKTPAALMVFQDGGGYIHRDGLNPALNVIDNLIAQKKIPVMICVFVDPGDISGSPGTPTYKSVQAYADQWHRALKDSMRSVLYDTVSDRYARFVTEELVPEVGAKYQLRSDAYSRAITGLSSGGICSFNAAWQMPGQFSRVVSWIGSFTSIQWKENPAVPDGGQDYPEKVLREPHRNIRVWLQDGANDQENSRYGSWPLANIRMANALKLKSYDFHFSFGNGTHNSGHGAAEFGEEMIWLWRDYDPSKTEQNYETDPSELAKPLFRVTLVGR